MDFEPVRALLSCLGSPTKPAVLLSVEQLLFPLCLLSSHKTSHYYLQPHSFRGIDQRATQIIERLHLQSS